ARRAGRAPRPRGGPARSGAGTRPDRPWAGHRPGRRSPGRGAGGSRRGSGSRGGGVRVAWGSGLGRVVAVRSDRFAEAKGGTARTQRGTLPGAVRRPGHPTPSHLAPAPAPWDDGPDVERPAEVRAMAARPHFFISYTGADTES